MKARRDSHESRTCLSYLYSVVASGVAMQAEDKEGPKVERRVSNRWPMLTRDDLADVALGQASLLEALQRRYDRDRNDLAAEIAEFELGDSRDGPSP